MVRHVLVRTLAALGSQASDSDTGSHIGITADSNRVYVSRGRQVGAWLPMTGAALRVQGWVAV